MRTNPVALVVLVILLLGASSGCKKKDYGTVTVPANFTTYTGQGYTLKLPPGWRAVPGNGGVNFYPPDAVPPFMSNIFIKTGDPGTGNPRAVVAGMKKELNQL